ncbi:MAG: CRISPR-associated RAMP protein [Deltaproteobacteria bacterium]|nr:CRISPR-associated RAMP protein [Deltaproteobacteria bacterium]
MRKQFICDARFALTIETRGPVLIKAGESGVTGPDMAFVRTYGYGLDKAYPYLPGSSLKGVFRSYVEQIARTLKPNTVPVCLPYNFERGQEQSCGKRFNKQTPRPEVYRKECLACRMFGSLEFKGRVLIDDAYSPAPRDIVEEVRDGVAIDRKTGGAANKVKYDLEVVTRGLFKTSVTIENFETWQLGAMWLVLSDLKDERIRIGMGTSRGLGHVKGTVESLALRYHSKHNGRLAGIERLGGVDVGRDYGLFSSGKELPNLGQHVAEGLWNVHRIEGEAIGPVMSSARDEFVAFIEKYRWNGGGSS